MDRGMDSHCSESESTGGSKARLGDLTSEMLRLLVPKLAIAPRVVRPALAVMRPTPRFLATDAEVVVPDVVDTLEWTLTSPPPLHQFEEPPIIVEIAHLDALPTPAH